MREKAATIDDVARHAGVSPMTVSRVINGEANVRDTTRARVVKSIEALKYRPNHSARALAGNRAYKIAFLYGNPSAFYLSELLVGALEEISKFGHQLLVQRVSESASPDEAVEGLSKVLGEYDGVIVPPPLSDSEIVRTFLLENDIPAVFLSGVEGNGRSRKICIDDYKAAKEITNHLIDLGHARIGFIKGNPNQFSSGERLRGYQDALAKAGVSFDQKMVMRGLFTYNSGLAAAKKLLALPERPSAIFASNDDMAAAVLAVAAEKGIPVPGELSVVGFDDSPLASAVFPRLTTVKQPLSKMAARAVDELIKLVGQKTDDSNGKRRLVMKHRLVIGDSTAALPG